MNFVVTGFTQKYWNPWGGCWLASLKLLANTEAQPVIVDFGLSKRVVKLLDKHGVVVLKNNSDQNFRVETMRQMLSLSQSDDDKFIYFDADVWFQDSFDGLFDLLEDKLVAAENRNLGMIAGTRLAWKKFEFIYKIAKFLNDPLIFECFSHFENYSTTVDNIFNWTAMADLSEEQGKLSCKGITPCVLHNTGGFKKFSYQKKLLFCDKYTEECKNFYEVPASGVGKLFPKPFFDCK